MLMNAYFFAILFGAGLGGRASLVQELEVQITYCLRIMQTSTLSYPFIDRIASHTHQKGVKKLSNGRQKGRRAR